MHSAEDRVRVGSYFRCCVIFLCASAAHHSKVITNNSSSYEGNQRSELLI